MAKIYKLRHPNGTITKHTSYKEFKAYLDTLGVGKTQIFESLDKSRPTKAGYQLLSDEEEYEVTCDLCGKKIAESEVAGKHEGSPQCKECWGKWHSVEDIKNDERLVEGKRKVCYTALLVGDEHWSYQCDQSINIVYQFVEKHKNEIDEVVFGGDGIDASALGKHLNLEEKKNDLYTEMEAFKNYAEKIKSMIPNAKMSALEDNHYHLRKARFIAENPAMKNMIKDIKFNFNVVVKHGKPYFPLNEYGNNLIAGIHGIFFNDVFTKNNTMNYPYHMLQFHTHTIQMYKGNNGLISYGMPCLCKKEMAYLQGRPTRWENGFGVLKYFPKEHRYTIEYCIIRDGIGIYRDEVYKVE